MLAAVLESDLWSCHLDRKMNDLVWGAGFRVDAVETGYMQGPKPWTFMYQGSAAN